MAFPNNPPAFYPGSTFPPAAATLGRTFASNNANPMSGLKSLTNPYWVPEPELLPRTTQLQIDHHLGFSIPKPWPLPPPQTIYNGSGPVPGVREMVFTQFTDSAPVGGKLPSQIRPSNFRREKFITRV